VILVCANSELRKWALRNIFLGIHSKLTRKVWRNWQHFLSFRKATAVRQLDVELQVLQQLSSLRLAITEEQESKLNFLKAKVSQQSKIIAEKEASLLIELYSSLPKFSDRLRIAVEDKRHLGEKYKQLETECQALVEHIADVGAQLDDAHANAAVSQTVIASSDQTVGELVEHCHEMDVLLTKNTRRRMLQRDLSNRVADLRAGVALRRMQSLAVWKVAHGPRTHS
jgi:hypothetical protein